MFRLVLLVGLFFKHDSWYASKWGIPNESELQIVCHDTPQFYLPAVTDTKLLSLTELLGGFSQLI